MDAGTRDLLMSIEGRDENGVSNAVCGIHIFSVGEDPPVEVRGYTCIDAEVMFRIIPRGMSEIVLLFDDSTDYDFLQVADVCREFNERMDDGEECVINLALTNSEDYEEYISAMCRSWAYDIPSPEKECNGIRFFVEAEQLFVITVPGGVEKRKMDPMGEAYDVDWVG